LPAHWEGGARARISAAHFALQNTNSVGAKSEGEAEGGCGGNSAVFLQKIEASPAALLVESRTQQKSFLFLLEEKMDSISSPQVRRAQNEKSKEYFSVVRRALASGGGAASFIGGRLKMRSDFVQGVEAAILVCSDLPPSST